jgi:hypothetical protein
LILVFIGFNTQAQYTLLGAGGFGRGNALVASSEHSAIYFNPAGIANQTQNFVASTYYRHVPVSGFNTLGIYGTYRLGKINLGFSADSFGDSDYHENRIGAAAAIKKDKVAIGLKFSYLNNAIAEVSSKQTILGEFGILVDVNKKVNLGMRVSNFTRAKLYKSQELPTLIALGLAYKLSPAIALNTELDYIVAENTIFKAGLSYKFSEFLTANTGITPYLKAVHFGIEAHSNPWIFQIAVMNSANVGLSNQFSIIRNLSK